MPRRSRALDRAAAAGTRSGGRPPAGRREHRVRFWEAIARGASSENAAVEAGVLPSIGVRWFRKGGGMPPLTLAPVARALRPRVGAAAAARGQGLARELGVRDPVLAYEPEVRRVIYTTDERFKPGTACGARSSGFRLRAGRGRPPSEAQVLGLMPAAQLAPQRAFQSRPVGGGHARLWLRGGWIASRRPVVDRRARPAERFELALADCFEGVRGSGTFRPWRDGKPARSSSARRFLSVSDGRAKRSPRRVRSSSSTGTPACGRWRRSRSGCRDGRGYAQRTPATAPAFARR